ncbi:transposase [Streptomyces sp. NPDC057582]|uniref:transposase n=1 Tax=unclassified Streptomyces TaxID=2593676 RepID=UPI0036CA5B48
MLHYPPKVALSKLFNSLKGVSSRCLRAEYTDRINRIGMGPVSWSRSYFAGSCGGAPCSGQVRRTLVHKDGTGHAFRWKAPAADSGPDVAAVKKQLQ